MGPSHRELKIVDDLVELYHKEEILWRQRSRVECLIEGDKNTKYFHLRATMIRRKNLVASLQAENGDLITNISDLERMITDFYWKLYKSEGVTNMNIVLDAIPVRVTEEMNLMLTAEYTKEEVKTALFQMAPSKAPGPDGFPVQFFQKHWAVCGYEVTDIVNKIVEGKESPASINNTFLVLISKVKSPVLLSQFRPISLCNVLYKIASKVVANTLKLVLPDIISQE